MSEENKQTDNSRPDKDVKDKPAGAGEAKSSTKPATPKILDDISKSTSAKGARTAGAGKRQQNRTGIGRLLALLLLIAPLVAALLYLAWQQLQLQQSLASLSQQNQTLQSRLASQDSQLQELLQAPAVEIPDNTAALEQLSANLNAEIQRLRQQLADLQTNQSGAAAAPDFNWKIFEAEYLIAQAAQKLQLEADLDSALLLLQQADAALLASGHSAAFAVRQALADDMAILRATETVDREGLYLRLDNMVNNVANLDLLSSMRENFENQRARDSVPLPLAESDSAWWSAGLEFLGEIFVWRRWEERPEAILAPGQETLIKLNLRLQLKQTQLALMDRDQAGFQQALAEAGEILRRYAVTDSEGGRVLSNELQSLQGLNINPPLPSLTESLNRIRQLAESER
jgi:uroporphyrin-3 C-methyltransferase